MAVIVVPCETAVSCDQTHQWRAWRRASPGHHLSGRKLHKPCTKADDDDRQENGRLQAAFSRCQFLKIVTDIVMALHSVFSFEIE